METKSAPGATRKVRGWTLKHVDAQEIERSECGHRRRLFSSEDASPAAFLHLVKIHEARPHYHRLATEYYYVLSGRGTMVLDGEEVALSAGSCLEVRPGTVHAARGDLLVLVIGVPRIDVEDTYAPDS